MRPARALGILCLCIFVACQDHQLLHNLSEADASRLAGRLHREQIEAEKVIQADGRWSLSVPDEFAVHALEILTTERLLPDHSREKPPEPGLFASKETQRLAYEQAVAHQIEELLLGIDGVFDARVSLRLPEAKAAIHILKDEKQEASAAVLLLLDQQISLQVTDIQNLVSGAAGIKPETVQVLIRKSSSLPEAVNAPDSLPVTVQEKSGLKIPYLFEVLLSVAGALLAVFFYLRREKAKRGKLDIATEEWLSRMNHG